MGVVVGTHVDAVAPAASVDVIHQVVDICEVVWQIRDEEVVPVVDAEAVVEAIVEVFDVVEGAAELSVDEEGVGVSVVESEVVVSLVVGAAVVAAAESVVVGLSLVVGVSVVVGASVVLGAAVVFPFSPFCRFRRSSPGPAKAQLPRSISAAVAASISEHPAFVRHPSISSKLFNCDRHREMLSRSPHEI